jgi:hypothetical protein
MSDHNAAIALMFVYVLVAIGLLVYGIVVSLRWNATVESYDVVREAEKIAVQAWRKQEEWR